MRNFIERLLRRINEYLMRKFPPVPVRKDLIPEDDDVLAFFDISEDEIIRI